MSNDRLDTPDAIEAAFYAAFEAADTDAMSRVWADSPDICCVHPGSGLLSGRQAVVQSWAEIFAGASPPAIAYQRLGQYESTDLVVHLVEERIRPRDEHPDKANRVLATNVYVRFAGEWRLVEHHASLPLVRGASSERRLH